jgi:hypothetical protein
MSNLRNIDENTSSKLLYFAHNKLLQQLKFLLTYARIHYQNTCHVIRMDIGLQGRCFDNE